jgi:recombinational DNA repair protein RecR
MARVEIERIKLIRDTITKDMEEGKPTENYFTLMSLIDTVLEMQNEIEELNRLRQKIKEEKAYLEKWKQECISLAIDALTECTHKYRDDACKKLLKHLQNMTVLFDVDGLDGDLPF